MIILAETSLKMSSREIAELTGKAHQDVLRDIRNMLDELNQEASSFAGYYIAANGKQNPMFNLPKDLTITLISGYNVTMRHRIVTRWQELEGQSGIKQVPQSLPEALRLAADLAEKAQIAAAERDEAIRTKALIGSRREASAMGKASAAVRLANKLRDQLGFNTRHATVTAVENATGEKYEWLPLRKWCKEHGVTPETIPDKRYGEVKAWPADAWGEVYGVDLADVFSVEVTA